MGETNPLDDQPDVDETAEKWRGVWPDQFMARRRCNANPGETQRMAMPRIESTSRRDQVDEDLEADTST